MLLRVELVRFVDDHQPGWAEAQFVDANGQRHSIIDKVPIFTSAMLDSNSEYPHPGSVMCQVVSRWKDSSGRSLTKISTEHHGIESTTGITEFIVFSEQLERC